MLSAIEKQLPNIKQITIPADFEKFCTSMPLENGRHFSFDGRDWLRPVCRDISRQVSIVKGRQTGITTWIIAKIIHTALINPKTVSLYCTDTYDHATKFSQDRLDPILELMGMARHHTEKKISRAVFPNGSILYVISGYSNFKQARSIPADFVYLDEAQHLPIDTLANIKEAMAQSPHKRLVVCGTGDWEGSPWHRFYSNTNCQEWTDGKWQALSDGLPGYHISQELMPNITAQDLEDKRRDYSPATYTMEVLGDWATGAKIPLPYSLVIQSYTDALHVLPPSQIDRDKGKLYAAIDWASGGDAYTVLTIVQHQQHQPADMLQVIYLERYNDSDIITLGNTIADKLDEYNPDHVYCDLGGNQGSMQVLESRRQIVKVHLAEHPANPIIPDTSKDLVKVDKSTYLQKVIQRFESRTISIPLSPDTEWSIDHLTAEESRTVTKSTGSTVQRFELMANRNDDFLMSLVFLAVALDPQSPGNFVPESYIV